MSAEGIAQLRFEVETAQDLYGEKHPALRQTFLRVSPADLSALFAAYDEAVRAAGAVVEEWDYNEVGMVDGALINDLRAVLAKAGGK